MGDGYAWDWWHGGGVEREKVVKGKMGRWGMAIRIG